MADALILTGGVAKGAFGAGALSVLTKHGGMDVRRVVATSSGAVNGVHFAAALRRGDECTGSRDLAELWVEHGTFGDVFDIDLRGLTSLEGLSTNAKLLALLRRTVRASAGTRDIELHMVVTGTAGVMAQRAPEATTFERVLAFDGSAFEGGPGFEFMLEAVTASAAFPFAFLPVHLKIRGETVACYDGGLADNAPVRHALDDPAITRVFVIAPSPRVLESSPGDAHGIGLLAHLGDVLISERLYRDLRRARGVNDALAKLEALLTPDAHQKALEALGWRGRRRIEIVEIRPTVPLEGNAFDGFFSRRLREDYVRAGEESARGWIRDRPETQGPLASSVGPLAPSRRATMFGRMNSNDLTEVALELRRRFGAGLGAAYVPGKTFFRDALCEQRGISQEDAEALCDSLELAKLIRFDRSANGGQWIIEP